jgi:SAM-dependent methyltransferase
MRALVPGALDASHGAVATPVSVDSSFQAACDPSGPDQALVELGSHLLQAGYRFTTITPASHKRVVSRPCAGPATLRDIFGWSRPFNEGDLPERLLACLVESHALHRSDGMLRSAVRFSTLGDEIFAHSSFPTEQCDAIFFGPDTYRFVRALRPSVAKLSPRPGMRILDVGAGSGAGGLHAASLLRGIRPRVVLSDINRNALRFSRINAALNRVEVDVVESNLYADIDGKFDLIISNPPYLVDPAERLYRHGGGRFGSALSLKIVAHGIERLAPKGRLVLYTGSAIVDGIDLFHEALCGCVDRNRAHLSYEEIDPDVFGEELDLPPYDEADRIAAVLAVIEVM